MTRIEDIPNKSELIKQYYQWLLDSDTVSLEKELDLTLAPSYDDPYIYYPECMHDIFHTQALQKLGRITHLSAMYHIYPNAYHSRLEHSIAAYGKKQEEHIYLWRDNPLFVEYVEKNNLKKYLLAEEVKMLYHDVGHLPFSHVAEHEIIGKKGVHEEIGLDILLTDPEVLNAAAQLGISEELKTVLTEDILNSFEHDDGNIDVDRKAFLQTDSLRLGGPQLCRYPIYSRKIAEINPDGSYKKAPDGHVILSDSLGPNSKFIDVYSYSDFKQVEGVLYGRENLYKNGYYHPYTLTHDTILGLAQSKIAPQNSEYCPEIVDYIDALKNRDFKSAKKYDEADIYKYLIQIGLNSPNPDVVDMISLVFVPFDNFLELMYEMLDKSKDSDFINLIHKDIINGNSRFATNVRTKNFFEQQVSTFKVEDSNELKNKGLSHLIYNSHSHSAYSSSVFVESADGNVFALEEHPNRSRNWSNTRASYQIAICILPFLRLQGLSEEEINHYISECQKIDSKVSAQSSLTTKINMKHCQTHNSIYSYFSCDDSRDEL